MENLKKRNAQLKRENRISFDIEKENIIKRMITLILHI